MTLALPLVIFLGIVVVLLIRSRDLAIWHVLIVGLFGFYLARTHLADSIAGAVSWIVTGLTHTA
jgi:hypothetical protein